MRVAVVGAGPAGSRVAERLAHGGHEVTVFDPSHPREKPCGGGVTPAVFEKIPELRTLQPLGRPAEAVVLSVGGGAALRIVLPRPIYVLSRRVLDGALLDRATGAGSVLRRERVHRARVEREGAFVDAGKGWERFEFVIGADGAGSVVRRALLGETAGGFTWATGGFYVEGLPEEDLYIEFLPDLPGYLWVFPRPDHASVGVLAPAGTLGGQALRQRALDLLSRRYPGGLDLPRRPYGASIPTPRSSEMSRPRIAGRRFALIGDAAAQVDAITGEGIHHALHAADLLSSAIEEGGAEAAPGLYSERWRRGPGRDLRLAARWVARYYGPRTVRFALGVARRSRRARAVMTDLLMVLQPYSRLRGRLMRELVRPSRRLEGPPSDQDGSSGEGFSPSESRSARLTQ
jgi:flavin-dependent dehydrogenase